MVAIQTRYVGPSNVRGSRIIAERMDRRPDDKAKYGDSGKVTVPYDDSLDSREAHDVAALALIRRMGWTGTWHRGGTNLGYVYVLDGGRTDDCFIVSDASMVIS